MRRWRLWNHHPPVVELHPRLRMLLETKVSGEGTMKLGMGIIILGTIIAFLIKPLVLGARKNRQRQAA